MGFIVALLIARAPPRGGVPAGTQTAGQRAWRGQAGASVGWLAVRLPVGAALDTARARSDAA
jgi:hypothetical protein